MAKVEGWQDAAAARKEILECVARYQIVREAGVLMP
jgi:inorganic pyrophosphatase